MKALWTIIKQEFRFLCSSSIVKTATQHLLMITNSIKFHKRLHQTHRFQIPSIPSDYNWIFVQLATRREAASSTKMTRTLCDGTHGSSKRSWRSTGKAFKEWLIIPSSTTGQLWSRMAKNEDKWRQPRIVNFHYMIGNKIRILLLGKCSYIYLFFLAHFPIYCEVCHPCSAFVSMG